MPNRLVVLLFAASLLTVAAQDHRYAIAIHGGAGSASSNFSKEANAKRTASMKEALTIGTDILKEGGTSLDAVEAVVQFLENDSQFNAGRGAVFNAAGGHELDASIMDGKNLACGAVAGVTTVKNPIGLARLVMTDTRHVLLSGPGADQFAKEKNVPLVPQDYFHTLAARKAWQDSRAKHSKGTVGCVALDSEGNLAAATSTGGLSNKQFGRVGDSPIIGAGTYADNATCAVSCTGVGEEYIRRSIAYDMAAQMRYANVPIDQAAKEILTQRLKKGTGGIIAIDKDGKITMQFNTGGMARAAADSKGRFEVIWVEEK